MRMVSSICRRWVPRRLSAPQKIPYSASPIQKTGCEDRSAWNDVPSLPDEYLRVMSGGSNSEMSREQSAAIGISRDSSLISVSP